MHLIEYEKITIYEVESLYKDILEWCHDSEQLNLDFTNVQKVDFAGIQLLLSVQKSVSLNLHSVSNNVKNSFALVGTDALIAGVNND